MANSARSGLSATDYVSIVSSLYSDKRTMVLGTMATAVACGASALASGSEMLWTLTGLFIFTGVLRFFDMRAFDAAAIEPDDAKAAAHWELRATIWASIIAVLHGMWCLISLALVRNDFAALASMSLSIAQLVGVAARNFGIDRLVTLQSLFFSVPMATGLFLVGEVYHAILAALLIPFFLSIRRLAGAARRTLLNALAGRHEASRLAAELDTALSTMQHGLYMLDAGGLVTVVNDRGQQTFLGTTGQRLIGRSFETVVQQAVTSGKIAEADGRRLVEDLRQRSMRKTMLALSDGSQCEITVSARGGRSVILIEDVSDRVRAQERINYMARHDGLTGLPNRSNFSEQVEAVLRKQRTSAPDEDMLFMIVDLDDFKHVNDSYGHVVGDQLLIASADRLRSAFGPEYLVSRLGGDEFLVFCTEPVDEAAIQATGKAIMEAFTRPIEIEGFTLSIAVSIGAVVTTAASASLDSMLTRADLALYCGKGNGKAQFVRFREEMDVEYRQRERMKRDLRETVGKRGLSLVFQPIIDFNSKKVVCCEALARWHHPDLGSISPGVFIPLAEEMGIITEISRYVLGAAMNECLNWPGDVRVSVNLSASDFRDTDVAQMVIAALEDTGLPPHRLDIEVTETALIGEKDAAIAALTRLGRHGVNIVLDDFGTGYSSLSYLHDLPFTKLKIDRSFMFDVTTNSRSLKLLSNIARLAKNMGMTVTLEGVETEEQLRLVTSHADLDEVQGFLFGLPLPSREIGELVTRLDVVHPRRIERAAQR
ncbi:MAG TPA: EAL domain-containing protein [Devosiaceae bacterium]